MKYYQIVVVFPVMSAVCCWLHTFIVSLLFLFHKCDVFGAVRLVFRA